MATLPKIWKDGTCVRFKGARGYEILAKCIDKESFKINRVDKPVVLFYTSSKPEFMQYLRGEIKEHSLTMTEVR